MGWAQLAGALIALALEVFKFWLEKRKEVKEARNETIKQIQEAIRDRDVAKYTYALQRSRGMR